MFKEEIKAREMKCEILSSIDSHTLQETINKWLTSQPESTVIYGIEYQTYGGTSEVNFSALIVYGLI